MNSKFNCGDVVIIKICNIVGVVVSLLISSNDIRYDVCYPDDNGLPKYSCFYGVELKLTEDIEFGFGKDNKNKRTKIEL